MSGGEGACLGARLSLAGGGMLQPLGVTLPSLFLPRLWGPDGDLATCGAVGQRCGARLGLAACVGPWVSPCPWDVGAVSMGSCLASVPPACPQALIATGLSFSLGTQSRSCGIGAGRDPPMGLPAPCRAEHGLL